MFIVQMGDEHLYLTNKSQKCKAKNMLTKELSLQHKIKYLNLNIFRTRCCKPLIFQTQIVLCYRIHSLKYLRYATFGCKVIVIRKSEFVAKTQFLCFVTFSTAKSDVISICAEQIKCHFGIFKTESVNVLSEKISSQCFF